MDNRIVLLSAPYSSMGILEVLASGMTGSGVLGQGLLQLLELCGCHGCVSHLATLPITAKSPFEVSPDGDDAMWPWHLKDQVGIIGDLHELGEWRSSQESIVRRLKIGDLKLSTLHAEIVPNPEGYGKSDLIDRGHCCTRDYAMERSPTEVQ
jgi:hypothetical protein